MLHLAVSTDQTLSQSSLYEVSHYEILSIIHFQKEKNALYQARQQKPYEQNQCPGSENKMNVRSGHFSTVVYRTFSANSFVFHSIYSRTPLIPINWESKPSGKAENPDNWIFL
jgi:hypothetical protein